MNKILLTILLVMAYVLTACGSAVPANTTQVVNATQVAVTTQASAGVQPANTNSLNTNNANTLPVEYQLLLGTFKLEGTAQAVTADQAKLLLPLWQQIQKLSPSMG